MSRVRSLARRVFLGWLAAEWVGILVAYSVAVLAFAFLIGVILLHIASWAVWFFPVVILLPAAGMLLVWTAVRIPRDLIRQARGRSPGDELPDPTRSPPTRDPPASASKWSSTRLVSRLETLLAIDRSGRWSTGRTAQPSPRLDSGSAIDAPIAHEDKIQGQAARQILPEADTATTLDLQGNAAMPQRGPGLPDSVDSLENLDP